MIEDYHWSATYYVSDMGPVCQLHESNKAFNKCGDVLKTAYCLFENVTKKN